jgi:hypothetical protein
MQNAELQRILSRFMQQRPVMDQSSSATSGLDLSRVKNADDRTYCQLLTRTMLALDAGNPNVCIGFNVLDGLYVFFMCYFKARIGEEEYPILRNLPHPQVNWNPIHSMFCQGTEVGVVLFVKVNPFPSALPALPAPPIQQALPAPPQPQPSPAQQLVLVQPVQPQQQLVPVTEPKPRRGRSASKKETLVKPRKGALAFVARMLTDEPEKKKKKRRSRSPRRKSDSSSSSSD